MKITTISKNIDMFEGEWSNEMIPAPILVEDSEEIPERGDNIRTKRSEMTGKVEKVERNHRGKLEVIFRLEDGRLMSTPVENVTVVEKIIDDETNEGSMGGINRCAPSTDVSYEKVLDEVLGAWAQNREPEMRPNVKDKNGSYYIKRDNKGAVINGWQYVRLGDNGPSWRLMSLADANEVWNNSQKPVMSTRVQESPIYDSNKSVYEDRLKDILNIYESEMSNLDAEIGETVDRPLQAYKTGRMDADHLGDYLVRTAQLLARKYNTDHATMQNLVNQYAENAVAGTPLAENFPYDVDHMPGRIVRHQSTNCTTCHGRKAMYKLDNKLYSDNKQGAVKIKCPTCKGSGDKQGITEADSPFSKILNKQHTDIQAAKPKAKTIDIDYHGWTIRYRPSSNNEPVQWIILDKKGDIKKNGNALTDKDAVRDAQDWIQSGGGTNQEATHIVDIDFNIGWTKEFAPGGETLHVCFEKDGKIPYLLMSTIQQPGFRKTFVRTKANMSQGVTLKPAESNKAGLQPNGRYVLGSKEQIDNNTVMFPLIFQGIVQDTSDKQRMNVPGLTVAHSR